MIKELLNIELKGLSPRGMAVWIIKTYQLKIPDNESFVVHNYSIILIRSGELKIRLKEVTHELSGRDLLVIPKKNICTLLGIKDKVQFFLLCFTSDFAFQNCLKKELVDSFYLLMSRTSAKISLEEKDYLVLSLIYRLIDSVNKATSIKGHRDLQRIAFDLFLHELRWIYNKYTLGNTLDFGHKEVMTIKFITLLAMHSQKEHGAKFYADALCVTSGHLNRIVREVTGKTVKGLIAQAIISRIKDLLENSAKTLADIAEECEFRNSSNFSAFFKSNTGVSPSEYRAGHTRGFEN